MSSRALSLATVLLLIGFGAADTTLAQAQNLEAGKSPSQIFAQTCNACHKSPRGLLKTVAPGSLPGFLRQHYTTSSDMAGVLASYLVSNGATDTRYGAGQAPKGAKEGAKEATSSATQGPEHARRSRQEAARPEGEASSSESGRPGQKRLARPGEEGARPDGQATNERGPDGRRARQHLSKRGKPESEEAAPKAEAPAAAVPSAGEKAAEPKSDATKSDTTKSETAKTDTGRDEAKPSGEAKSDAAKSDAAKPESGASQTAKTEPTGSDAPALRPDPVPPVTPALPSTAKSPEPSAAGSGSSEPRQEAKAPESKAPEAKPQDAPPASTATAAAPPSPPVAPAGEPVPPISQ
ncbi:hypothetical protein [Bradyrhizobium sp.]|uniref:hypothetical protein n=1 Tax=Bradyrhizobium sp. TaxID=376 RepID=UPI0023A66FA1|nr:hypothetical protein [Bradyrhizobium sp.]MDE2376291.1 hypothetical protein [Bradyrhizobium sp.]